MLGLCSSTGSRENPEKPVENQNFSISLPLTSCGSPTNYFQIIFDSCLDAQIVEVKNKPLFEVLGGLDQELFSVKGKNPDFLFKHFKNFKTMLFLAMHGGVAIYLMVQWDVFETPFMHILKFSVQHQNIFVKCFIKIKTFGRTKH